METPSQRFAIVQWEDSFTSIINLNSIVLPQKAPHLFTEGEYVVALFGKKKYNARISDISDHKRDLIAQQTSDGKFPLQYLYEDRQKHIDNNSNVTAAQSSAMKTPVELVKDSFAMQLSNEFEEGHEHDNAAGISSLATKRLAKDADLTVPVINKKNMINVAKDGQKSPPVEAKTFARNNDVSQILECTGSEKPSSDSASSPLYTPEKSSRKTLERRVSKLEKDLKKLKGTVKSIMNTEVDTCTTSISNPDKDLEGLLSTVKHLSASSDKEINECVKRLCFMVFDKNELATSSRTGKKTIRSGEHVKPALDQTKLQLLERAVLMKCETLTSEMFRKKIDNLIKMERRSEKGKK